MTSGMKERYFLEFLGVVWYSARHHGVLHIHSRRCYLPENRSCEQHAPGCNNQIVIGTERSKGLDLDEETKRYKA